MTTAKKKASPQAKTAAPKVVVVPKDPIKQLDDEYKQKRRALMREVKQAQRKTAQSDVAVAKKQIGILKRKYGWDAQQIARRLGLGK